MLGVSDYERLDVWRAAHALALDIYQATSIFPATERYGLVSQMRRSAASIPMNIAEGSGRSTDLDYARFIANAIGSASELEYQLLLAAELGYCAGEIADRNRRQAAEIRRMLTALRSYLVQSLPRSR